MDRPHGDRWYELCRYPAAILTRGGALERFVGEWFTGGRWEWIDVPAGLFALAGRPTIYRVERDGPSWVFAWNGGE